MSQCVQEHCDGYAFHFLDNITHPAVGLMGVGYEERSDRQTPDIDKTN